MSTTTFAERLVDRIARRRGPDRRRFLQGAAVVGAAVVTSPWTYLVRPASAYDAVCGANASCNDGYTVFCCTINGGQNTCPPDSFIGGWWKADQSSFCGGSARYYIDCNSFRDGRYPCRCNTTTCDQRLVNCNQFRYGQCSPEIPYSATGPVLCRLVSCTPPWQQYAGTCSTTSATDNNTATHSAPCVTGNSPVGALESVTADGRTVRITGWALDPDQPGTALSIAVYEDGVGLAWFASTVARPDVDAAYGASGTHGFDLLLETTSAQHTFAVYAIGVGSGPGNALLGTRTLDVPPGRAPVGRLEAVTTTAGTVRLTGWAFDPDRPATEIDVAVYADDRGLAQFPTGLARPDVDDAYGITGRHGFEVDVDLPNGPHVLTVYGIGVGAGGNTLIGRGQVEVNPGAAPRGVLESVVVAGDTVRLTGWAYDPDRPATSCLVAVYADAVGLAQFAADQPRGDVNTAFGIVGAHGFDLHLTVGPGAHTLTVYGINLAGGAVNPVLGSRSVTVGPPGPVGTLESATSLGLDVRLTGWALDPDHPARELQVAVYVDGRGLAWFPTGGSRQDVRDVYGVPGDHGFDLTFRTTAGAHTVTAYAIGTDRNVTLGSRTLTVGA